MSTRFASAKSIILTLTALTAGMSLLSGCGSGGRTVGVGGTGGAGTRAAKKGSVTLNVTWPTRPATGSTKVIPIAANSITVTLSRVVNGAVVTTEPSVTRTVSRPTTTLTVDALETGTYEVTAAAYPGTDGSGTAQATGPQDGAMGSASMLVTVNPGTNSPLPITLFATVASIRFTPATAQLRLGQKTIVTATAYDSDGNVVITATPSGASSIFFASSNSNLVSVTPITPGATAVNSATLQASATTSTSAGNNGQPVIIGATYLENGVAAGAQGTGVTANLRVTVTAVGLAASAWPRFHGDVGNTGKAAASAGAVIVTGAKSSSVQVGSQIVYSSPTINAAGDTVYIGADDNNVYAVTVTANGVGKVKWAYPTGGAVEAAPLVDVNGIIYVGSQDGNMYAIRDAGTAGQLVYKFNAGAAITGSANLDTNGTLYFTTEPTFNSAGSVTTPGKLFFLDSLSGTQIMNVTGTAPLVFSGDAVGFNTTPALDAAQDLVYVGSESGILYAVSTANGTVRAQYPVGDSISQSSPVVGTTNNGEVVFQGTTGGKLYAFRAAAINDGPIPAFAPYTATGSILATPAYTQASQVLAVATYDNSSGQNDSRVAVVDANSGVEIARTTPILTYLSQRDPVLTQADLSQAQAFLFASSPAISGDSSTVYVGAEDGHVYSVNIAGLATGTAPTGTYLTFTSLIETAGNSQINPILIDSSPAIDRSGHVFIGGFDGSVYAITQ